MVIVVEPSPDRQTPSTDQLFAVRVAKYDKTPKEGLFSNANGSPTPAAKYYVGPNSVVIGSRTRGNYTTSGTKRRAVGSPVYDVIGSMPEGLMLNGTETAKNDFRVFGVAPDGVPLANAEGVDDNHDSLGRFSVIHHGVATINCPYDLGGGDDSKDFCFKDKKIGDAVFAWPFEVGKDNKFKYRFASDPDGVFPVPVKFVPREEFYKKMSASEVQTLLIGFLLETGGNRRNEIRVQLRLNACMPASIGGGDVGILTPTPASRSSGATGFSLNREDLEFLENRSGPFTASISAGMGDTLPDGCYAGNGPASVLGLAAAVVANETGVPVGPIGKNMNPVEVAACLANAPPSAVGIGPDLKPVAGSIAAQLMGHATSAPATSGQVAAIQGAIDEIAATNTMTGSHDVLLGGVAASANDLPAEVVASHHLSGIGASIAHPAMVQGLYPEGITLCPYQTAGISGEKREQIQKQIAAAVDGVRRAGGPCVHTFDSAGEMAGALESMLRGGL